MHKFLKSYYYAFLIKYTRYYRNLVDFNPRKAIDIMWYRCFQKKFPWDDPVTLNEKINWLSGSSDTSLWTKYSDKYEVRNYISSIGLQDILTECYGLWENVDDINFSELPSSFAIKCTHDCGSTIVVEDKSCADIGAIKEKIRKHLSQKMGYDTCEPHYTHIKPRIMAEEMLNIDSSISSSIVDYKFWVINGKALCCMLVYDRMPENLGGHYVLDLYSLRPWKQTEGLISEYDRRYKKIMPPPDNLEDMISIAEKIGKGFPQVRVDLYNIKGKIYFGEMTFTSQGGRMSYYTPEFQKMIGEQIDLTYGTK